MVWILENYGISIRVFKTAKPGYIVYEDEFQIVAEPVRDNRRRLI
jgi:hypothetical protein